MEFRLLGPLEVWHEGRNLPVRGSCLGAFAARGPAGAADDRPLPVGSPGAGSRDVPGGASRAYRRARHRAGAGAAGAGEGDPAEGPVTRASRGSTSASLHPGSRARRRRPPGAADDRAAARTATAQGGDRRPADRRPGRTRPRGGCCEGGLEQTGRAGRRRAPGRVHDRLARVRRVAAGIGARRRPRPHGQRRSICSTTRGAAQSRQARPALSASGRLPGARRAGCARRGHSRTSPGRSAPHHLYVIADRLPWAALKAYHASPFVRRSPPL
jgi:hypothetical protein